MFLETHQLEICNRNVQPSKVSKEGHQGSHNHMPCPAMAAGIPREGEKFPNTWIWRRIERGESALTKRKHPTTDMDNGRAHQRTDVSLSDCGEREGAGTEDWTLHATCMDGCFTLCEPCKEKQMKSPEGALSFSSAAHGTIILGGGTDLKLIVPRHF